MSLGEQLLFVKKEGKLKNRVQLEVIPTKTANAIFTKYHYLHRGRVMAQVAYGIYFNGIMIGAMSFALPMLSCKYQGYHQMEILEFARMWLRENIPHLATCAIGKALKRIKGDWENKFPHLPKVKAIVSWSDTIYHKGTIYKASNFKYIGRTKGAMQGHGLLGKRKHYEDFRHPKDAWIYKFINPLMV